jgi:threonine dehydrogenase-like Zn-dependent dehydrogenase
MKAIAIVPGTRTVHLIDRPEPSVAGPDDVKLSVVRVGICGTDREEAAGGRAKAPPSHEDLVLGHEMFGQVVDVGRAVTLVKPGDYAVFTVRRGCGTCRPCAMNRSDMCQTGLYAERGIWGLDGYHTQYVVDREPFVVRVAPELEAVGVVTDEVTLTVRRAVTFDPVGGRPKVTAPFPITERTANCVGETAFGRGCRSHADHPPVCPVFPPICSPTR